jgi:uncharacterized membrane protein
MPAPIERLWRLFLAGLATVLPLAVTLYLVYWIVRAAERLFGGMARAVLPDTWYVPGLGLLMAVGAILVVGAFVNAWIVASLIRFGERLLERIPLVKTVYTGTRDLMDFVSGSRQGDDLKQVVLVEIQPQVNVVGFVTDRHPDQGIPELAGGDGEARVAVYLPMGYQIGGYTLYLPESRVRPLDLPIEEAMRLVLTASVNRPRRRTGKSN